MFFGRPTGGAMPLLWAHAEYIKLVRSAADGQVFDLIPEVADRYRRTRTPTRWKSGSSIGRSEQCVPEGFFGFRHLLHFGCTGPATSGSRSMIHAPHRQGSALSSLTSKCRWHSELRSASPSSGRPWSDGKAEIFRSQSTSGSRPGI